MALNLLNDMVLQVRSTISSGWAAKTAIAVNLCLPSAFTNRHIFYGGALFNSSCEAGRVHVNFF